MKSLCTAMALLWGVTNSGCSFIFTRGPEPEVHPAPPCTTTNDAPAMDTILAVLSLGLFGLGMAAVVDGNARSAPPPTRCVDNCESGLEGATGVFGMAVGAALVALFTTSAVVGYQRTAACRAFVQPKAPPVSVSRLEACGPVADAPRACPASALLFGQR